MRAAPRLVDVGERGPTGRRLIGGRRPEQQHGHRVSPAGDLGDVLRHDDQRVGLRQAADAVRALPADRGRAAPPVAVQLDDRADELALARRASAAPRPSAGRSAPARDRLRRPVIVRSAGRTNTSKDTYADTGLPGSVKIGIASSPTMPKPCGLPGLHGDLDELDRRRAAPAPP